MPIVQACPIGNEEALSRTEKSLGDGTRSRNPRKALRFQHFKLPGLIEPPLAQFLN